MATRVFLSSLDTFMDALFYQQYEGLAVMLCPKRRQEQGLEGISGLNKPAL